MLKSEKALKSTCEVYGGVLSALATLSAHGVQQLSSSIYCCLLLGGDESPEYTETSENIRLGKAGGVLKSCCKCR